MDRGAWQAAVQRIVKSWTWLKRLSMHAHIFAQGYTISILQRQDSNPGIQDPGFLDIGGNLLTEVPEHSTSFLAYSSLLEAGFYFLSGVWGQPAQQGHATELFRAIFLDSLPLFPMRFSIHFPSPGSISYLQALSHPHCSVDHSVYIGSFWSLLQEPLQRS